MAAKETGPILTKFGTDVHQMNGKDFFTFFETFVYGTEFTDPFNPIDKFPYLFTCVTTRWHPVEKKILQQDPIVLVNLDAAKAHIEIPWSLVGYAFEERFPAGWLGPTTLVKVVFVSPEGGIIIKAAVSLILLLAQDKISLQKMRDEDLVELGNAWEQARLKKGGPGRKLGDEDDLNVIVDKQQLSKIFPLNNFSVKLFVEEVWLLQGESKDAVKNVLVGAGIPTGNPFKWRKIFAKPELNDMGQEWQETLRIRRCKKIGESYFLNSQYNGSGTPSSKKWATLEVAIRKIPFAMKAKEPGPDAAAIGRMFPEKTKKQEKVIQLLLNEYENLKKQEICTLKMLRKSESLEQLGKAVKQTAAEIKYIASLLCEKGYILGYLEGNDLVFNLTLGLFPLLSVSTQENLDFVKIAQNTDALFNASSVILKFYKENGRYPNRAETWKLGVGIEILDACSVLVNLPIQDMGPGLLAHLTPVERSLLDGFSIEFLKKQGTIQKSTSPGSDVVSLPKIMEIPNINIIFAKLLIPFINAVLESYFKEHQSSMPFLETEFSYFNFKKLDGIATRAITFKAEHPGASLVDMCVAMDLGIWTVKLALFFYEFILQNKVLAMTPLMKEKDFKECAEKYRLALVKSYREGFPLTIDTLVKKLGNSFLDAKIILEIHQSNPTVKWTPEEVPGLNDATLKLARYLEHKKRERPDVQQQPSIAELVAELEVPVKIARNVIPFMNYWMDANANDADRKIQFNLEKLYPELDQLARNIVSRQRKNQGQDVDYVAIMAEFNVGIIEVRSALDYYRWVTEEYQSPALNALLPERVEILDALLKNVLIHEGSSKTLTSEQLVDMNFTLRNALDMLAYYRQVQEEKVDYKNGPIETLKRFDQVAREIFNAKEAGKFDTFDISKMLAAMNFTFRDTWHGLLFLKTQVMPEISSNAPIVQEIHAKVALQSNPLALQVAPAEEPAQAPVELLKGTVDIPKFQVKVETVSPPINPGATIKRQYEYIGGKVRVKAKITNDGLASLLRVRLALDVPPSFQFLRAEPPEYDHEGPAIKVQDLLPGEEKAVAWVLEPLICGKERVGGSATGVDAQGNPFAVALDPLEIEVRCPLFATPEEVNLPAAKKILDDLAVRNQRVFLLPDTLSEEDALMVVTKVISERDVRRVGETAKGAERQAWFYGITKVGKKRFIFIAGASKADRTIRIATACDEEAGCTGFLAETGAAIRRELVRRGAVDSEDHVVELICEQCGATLPRAPAVGVDVLCPECKRVWKVTDFIR